MNAADLEKHFIWCVGLRFKRAAEINFDSALILTGVYFPKLRITPFFLTECQFHRRQKVYEAGFTGTRIKTAEDSRKRSFGKLPFNKRNLVLITGSVFSQLLKFFLI